MSSKDNINPVTFLQWALPRMGYRWDGFRKPRGQVIKRIKNRMSKIGLNGLDEYSKYLQENRKEWSILDRMCDVTISKFFRDREMWNFLEEKILPDLIRSQKPKPVRIWSAGCCNGEEPYSAAMIMSGIAESGCNSCIIGSDRNPQVLERAIKAVYPAGALKEMSDEEVDKYFQPVGNSMEQEFRVKTNIRQMIKFEQLDIKGQLPEKVFDLVFCRNLVFTYFSKVYQVEFLQKLKPRLAENGFLVIGANEKTPENDWLTLTSKTHRVFRKNG